MYNGNNTTERFCCYGSGVQNTYLVQLYKRHGGIKSITVESDLITAIETFMSPTNFECDPNGQTFDSEAWSNNSMFTSDLISKYDLAHVKADQSGNEVEQFLYKYDLVIWKMNNGYSAYKDATDFLGRLSLISTSNSNQIFRNSDNNTAILIVVLVSFASVTAIGGYFFIRKRKYN